MGWWNIGNGDGAVMGDEAAEVAAEVLSQLAQRDPRPTLDELLDALEAALRESTELVSEALGPRHLSMATRRTPGSPSAPIVEVLRTGLIEFEDTYRVNFKRLPMLSEVLHAISFVLSSSPREYLRDAPADKLGYAEIVE